MKALILVLGLFAAAKSYAYENVFYCTYQTETCVESSAGLSVNKSEIAELVERVGVGQENFIGFVDSHGTTIQFFVDGIDDILLEVPIPDEKGSYGKKINMAEMKSIVGDLESPYLNYIKSLKLVFSAW